MSEKWEKRLGFCKRCGRFGRVHGGSGERGYSLCRSCLDKFFEEQVEMFNKYGSPLDPNEEFYKVRGSCQTVREGE
jgi:hypothetical protein